MQGSEDHKNAEDIQFRIFVRTMPGSALEIGFVLISTHSRYLLCYNQVSIVKVAQLVNKQNGLSLDFSNMFTTVRCMTMVAATSLLVFMSLKLLKPVTNANIQVVVAPVIEEVVFRVSMLNIFAPNYRFASLSGMISKATHIRFVHVGLHPPILTTMRVDRVYAVLWVSALFALAHMGHGNMFLDSPTAFLL